MSGDTIVSIKENGIEKDVRFDSFNNLFNDALNQEWVDVKSNNLFALSKNAKYTKINKILRRKHQGDIYKVKLKNGYELKLTSDHIAVLDDFSEKKVSDLQIKDRLPFAEYPENKNPLVEINLIDALIANGNGMDVVVENEEYVMKCLPKELCDFIQGYKKRVLGKKTYEASKEKKFTIIELRLLEKYLNIDEFNIELKSQKSKATNKIAGKIKLTKQLGKFIGYVLTEGYISYQDSYITFNNKTNEILEDFISCVHYCFPNLEPYYISGGNSAGKSIMVSGSILCKLFDGILCTKHKSNNISIPKWYEFANKDFINGFLSAIIDGDGSVTKGTKRIMLSSCCELFVDQIQSLLSKHNISSEKKLYQTKGSKSQINGVVVNRNHDSLLLNIKHDYVQKFHNLVPDCKKLNYAYDSFNFEKNHQWLFDNEIVSITKEYFDDWVYDFETENHLFVANKIITHNCHQIDLQRVFKNGFSIGGSHIREPQSIRAAASLACIVLN